ncbi:MAG: hypothetical protein ACJAS1_006078 [Oleiphilaceae bacterium]|jgi:hypothetical protein
MKKHTPLDQNKDALIASKDTSAGTQRQQILEHLKRLPSINTLEFRALGFISPAPRILELRERGNNIKSVRETVKTEDGRTRTGVARYYISNIPPANCDDSEVAA